MSRIEIGALVHHRGRPGVWRILGEAGELLVIEPWDDQAAGSFHASEAYELQAPCHLIRRLRPGRAIDQAAGDRRDQALAMA